MIKDYDFIIYLILCSFVVLMFTSYFYDSNFKMFENPSDYANIFSFVVSLLIVTFIFMLILKYFKPKIKKNLLIIDLILIFSVFFSIFKFNIINFLVFLILVLIRIKLKMCKIINIFILPTVGILLGISLSPLILLIISYILALYDFFSVFISKHMVKMAKAISDEDTLLLLKFNNRKIGAGDYVVSLMIQSNFLLYFGFKTYIFCLVFQIVAFLIMKNVIEKYNISLPALVFIVPFSYLSFILSSIL